MRKNIMIIGLGLIGSSLAVCIKKEHPDAQLLGWDVSKDTCQAAIEEEIVHRIPHSFESGAVLADYIILAVPVKTAIHYLNRLEGLALKETVLVTDTGSTKQEIMAVAQSLSFHFIRRHPMAGSHNSGITAVNASLFENAFYIFTDDTTQKKASRIHELKQLLQGTRAKFVQLAPQEHDCITGMFSHLPHIIAAGLVNQSQIFDDHFPEASRFAAGGFRDMTRIDSSDPYMWTDILMSNQTLLFELIKNWQVQTSQVINWIQQEDAQSIYHFFENAKDIRDHLPITDKGTLPAFYDLMVDVPDYPGVIGEVTTILGQEKLSLMNLKILETREDIVGVLQISFKTKSDLQKAKRCIENQTNYHCRLL